MRDMYDRTRARPWGCVLVGAGLLWTPACNALLDIEPATLCEPGRCDAGIGALPALDPLPERYQVRDNDTASWRFGDGQITTRPIRFSMSLVDSSEHAAVAARAAFIGAVIR